MAGPVDWPAASETQSRIGGDDAIGAWRLAERERASIPAATGNERAFILARANSARVFGDEQGESGRWQK